MRRQAMSVAKVIELTASSPQSFEDAVQAGIEKSGETLRNVKGAWVSEQKVDVENGKIVEYRVTLRVTFVLD
jgi:dodecin